MRNRVSPAIVVAIVALLPATAQAHHRAHSLAITPLFSMPAQAHPKTSPAPKPIIECQISDGGAYRVCCIWNADESPYMPGVGVLPIVGAWDCTTSLVRPLGEGERLHPKLAV